MEVIAKSFTRIFRPNSACRGLSGLVDSLKGVVYSNRNIAIPTRCAVWENSPSLAHLAVFRGGARGLVARCARRGWAAAWPWACSPRARPFGPIHRSVLRPAGANQARNARGRRAARGRGRFDGRNADLRRQALSALRGLPSRATDGFAAGVQDALKGGNSGRMAVHGARKDKREALQGVLAQDPRPGYRRGDGRRFGVRFAGMDVRFTVADGQLTVCEIVRE